MEIVTGSTGEVHVTPIDDAVRNSNVGYLNDKVVFTCFDNFAATVITNNEVRISSGYGINQGRIFKIDNEEYDSVTIENGSQGYKRADLIVARYTMNTQTGFEDISLEAIRGNSGSSYVDPSYSTGNINGGDTLDDFPLYRVRLNGLVIEGVDRLFTLVPDGGRMGELEAQVRAHKTAFDALNVRTNLASESAVYLKNGANARPGVEGTLPASHGGTGQTTLKAGATSLIGALDSNGTTPADGDYYVGTTPSTTGYQRKPLSALWSWISAKLGTMGYGDMTKGEFCNNPDSELPTVKVEKGGTGQTTLNGIRNALGLGNDVTKPLSYDKGGTGITQKPSILVNLASESATDVYQATPRPGVTGTLPVKHGGTGLATSPSMLTNLGSTTAANVMQASPKPGITGTLAIAHGGTGATTVAGARNALKLGNTDGAVPVANGGTGATSASAARTNLGAMSTGGGTFSGNVAVAVGGTTGRLTLGNSTETYSPSGTGSTGSLRIYGQYSYRADLSANTSMSSNQNFYLPRSGGTLITNQALEVGVNAGGSYRLTAGGSGVQGDVQIWSSDYFTGTFKEDLETLKKNRVYSMPNSTGIIQVSSSSSRRVKENIHYMTEERAKKILDLDVVNFDYIGDFGGGLKDQSGVIAEDAVKVIPEAVLIPKKYDETKPVDEETNPAPSVDYRQYIPYLIKMVQMQQEEIEELKAALNK